MTDFVVDHLAARHRLAIIEDYEASPDDLALENWQEVLLPRLEYDGHVYWYAIEPDPSTVAEFMTTGFGLFKCMALTRASDTWPPASLVGAANFEDLADLADHIVVDAFDFEGFVVWTRAARAD